MVFSVHHETRQRRGGVPDAAGNVRRKEMGNQAKAGYERYQKPGGIHYVPVWRIFGFSGANMATNLYMGLTMIMSYYLNGYVGMAVFR
jgi:hypothetical protein